MIPRTYRLQFVIDVDEDALLGLGQALASGEPVSKELMTAFLKDMLSRRCQSLTKLGKRVRENKEKEARGD